MLVFVDGCDVYSTETQVMQRWNNSAGAGSVSVQATGGRFGGGALRFAAATSCWIGKYIDSNTVYAGCAIRRWRNDSTLGQQIRICQFRHPGGSHVYFSYSATGGTLTLHASDGTQLAQVGNTIDETWRFIEFGAYIDPTAGWAEARLNGDTTPIIRYEGPTQSPSAANDRVVELRMEGSNRFNEGAFVYIATEIDDIYVGDGQSGPRMGFQGDCKVITDTATADADQNGYTSTEATLYEAIDDGSNPDGDATRIVGTEVGHYATFAFPVLEEAPDAIYAVSVTHMSKKTDAGTGWVAGRAVDGEDSVTGPAVSVGSSYRYDQSLLTSAPDGGNWTKAKVDAASYGVEIVAAP